MGAHGAGPGRRTDDRAVSGDGGAGAGHRGRGGGRRGGAGPATGAGQRRPAGRPTSPAGAGGRLRGAHAGRDPAAAGGNGADYRSTTLTAGSTGEHYEYAYDAVGNRTAMTKTTALAETTVTTYTYDAAKRLTHIQQPASSIQYAWDARGTLLADGTFTYTYNAAGRLVRAESVTATLVYTYNAAGLRVAQSVDGNASTYAWDWATGVPELLSDGDALYLVGHDTLGHWDGEAWQYPHPDGLGSARQAVDAGATVVATREWTPYGVEVNGAQSGLGFTGEWFDAEVGLQYLRARWYDVEVGRFTSEDPWEGDDRQPQTLHAYVYALGNPMNFTDPSGKRPWPDPEPWPCHIPLHIDTFRLSQLPIAQPRSVQWFGNTNFAYNHRAWYNYSRGLHAGFDLLAPAGTPVFAGLYGTVVGVFRQASVLQPQLHYCPSHKRVVDITVSHRSRGSLRASRHSHGRGG